MKFPIIQTLRLDPFPIASMIETVVGEYLLSLPSGIYVKGNEHGDRQKRVSTLSNYLAKSVPMKHPATPLSWRERQWGLSSG